jgi:hypothetical protein
MQNIVSVSYLVNDDTTFQAVAQDYCDEHAPNGAIGTVRLGSYGDAYTVIQSTSPAALRRLAAALNDAADKAEAITEAGA